MNFSWKQPDSTKIYNYEFRIDENGFLEQFVTVIQHLPTKDYPLGIRNFWEPVQKDGSQVRVTEVNDSVIHILIKAEGGFRNVLGNGRFTTDKNGFLIMELFIFDGQNTIKSNCYVMNGPNRLKVFHP